MRPTFLSTMLMGFSIGLVGCNDSRSPGIVSVSASSATAVAMKELDSNSDGLLNSSELANCKSLATALQHYDTDGDSQISRSELEARLTSVFARGTLLAPVRCRVEHGRKAVANAAVVLTPASFLKDYLSPAEGTTDASGETSPAVKRASGELGPAGVQLGLYDVAVTVDGRSTEFGLEVAPASRDGLNPTFNLQQRTAR